MDDDISSLKRKEEELQSDLQKYVKTIDELSEKRRELVDRFDMVLLRAGNCYDDGYVLANENIANP